MPEGQIVRALSGFYYVEEKNNIWECKARGIFKKRNISPLVGDYVTFDIVSNNQGYIFDIKERVNELNRPPIANVDQALLVFSVKEPNFSSLLLDKLLVHAEQANIKPIICLTKNDLIDETDSSLENIIKTYENIGYKVIRTSKAGEGINELKNLLQNKVTVFAGQSGVGKSTLINIILPQLNLDTGVISNKLGRGKHTTRVVQLINLPFGGKVADTPGFSQLDFNNIKTGELANYFIETKLYSEQCRFRGCLHENEPECAVKRAVSEGKLNSGRYNHYLEFLQEIKEKEERKWR